VFNGAARLAASVAQIRRFLNEQCPWDSEILIVENGSTDGTWEIAKTLATTYANVEVMHLEQRGRGRALKHAWQASHADVLAYMDVDLSTDLSAFPSLIQVLAEGNYDLAIGSRLLEASQTRRSLKRELISRAYNRLVRQVFQTRFSDAQCGFKGIRNSVARELLPLVADNGWFFDTELLVLSEKLGYRIRDIPVRWVENPDSRVKLFHTIVGDLRGLIRLRRNLNQGKYQGKGVSPVPAMQPGVMH
jgi:glycosyltransferase involved in cell wall biosynthesis